MIIHMKGEPVSTPGAGANKAVPAAPIVTLADPKHLHAPMPSHITFMEMTEQPMVNKFAIRLGMPMTLAIIVTTMRQPTTRQPVILIIIVHRTPTR